MTSAKDLAKVLLARKVIIFSWELSPKSKPLRFGSGGYPYMAPQKEIISAKAAAENEISGVRWRVFLPFGRQERARLQA